MKKLFVCGLLMALALTACQNKGIEVLTQSRSKAFTAVVEESFTDGTKTSLDGDGNVLWKKGDQVSLFAGSTVNEQYQVSDDSDSRTSASLNKVAGGGFVAGTDIDNNVAFYPYASTAGIAKSESNYIISDITLSATQSYAAGSFGNGAIPMVAVTSSTEDMTLKFKNVLGGLKLQLKGTATITSISVTGNNDEILCGAAEVTTTYGGVPTISLSDASAMTVTLDCGAGVTLNTETATSFIIALPPMTMEGGFSVVVTDSDGKQMEIKTTRSQTIPRSNLLRMPAVTYEGTSPAAGPEAIDLGLPSGLKWASFNVGATAPEEYGGYFAWGETETKTKYNWSTYKYCNGSYNTLTKYCNNSSYGYNGFTDTKTVLDLEDDAAKVNWGGSWRMPTDAEWTELINNCTWTWTTQNGVNGYIVTSKTNSNSIFLPAAGRRSGTDLYYVGSLGYYWSSSLSTDIPDGACYVAFGSSSDVSRYYGSRYYGLSVRPVTGEGTVPTPIPTGKALLPPGQEFITTIKQLADPDAVYNSDVFITRISLNVNEPSTEGIIVSDLYSEVPIYAVYDNLTGHLNINTAAAEICTGEDASYLFAYLFQCEAIDNLSVLNTSAATTMFSMFNNYTDTDDSLVNEKICMTSLDVSHLNTENVTVFTNMFNNCRKLTSLDLSSFNTSNATNMQYMFSRCESLESLDLSNFDTQNVTNFNYFVNRCYKLTSLDVSSFNTSSATTMTYMFNYCQSLPYVDLSSFDVTAVEADGLKYMFNHCESMTSIDINHFNLENATSLTYFLASMYALESLDLSGLDTYNITSMSYIFYGQTGRVAIKLGGKFTTENCTTLTYMFYDNDAMVEFNAGDLDISSCTKLDYLFKGCDVLQKIDLSAMDLASATSITHMFERNPNLTELRLGEYFVHSKKPANFFTASTHIPGERTSSNPGVLTIYCDQDQADWLATTSLRFLYWGYYGESTSTAVIDGCPRITIIFKDRDTGADIGVDWPTPNGETYYPVTSVSLSSASISMTEGSSYQLTATVLPSNATDKAVSWTSSDTSVATVSSAGLVTALKGGSATINVTTKDGGYTASCRVNIIVAPDIVDLGLSVKWGSFNLGTDTPEGYGSYYAWGETEPKPDYSWSTYKYCKGSETTLTKYCDYSSYGYNGFTDNKTALDLSDDAARVKLGGSWRMPTDAEWTELREQCTWTWTTQNGFNGYIVTSKTNSNSIFLPAAGYRRDASRINVGSTGYYWSSSLTTDDPSDAWRKGFTSSGIYRRSIYRYYGQSVRPVYDPAIHDVTTISLNHSDLTFTKLSTVQTLTAEITPSDATNKNVTWSSSNTEVVTVSQDGKVTSVGYGTATITATTEDGGSATCNVRVITLPEGPVDLGLSVKWASFNVGASFPEEYGDYFAWGETAPKSNYDWSTYKYCNGSDNTLTKYCNDSSYGYNGFTDNKTILELTDDVANVKLGGSWRMPTYAEWTELRNNCTWMWTTQNGRNGYLVTSKTNNNSIFLPAAGYRYGTRLCDVGSRGCYWSSSLYTGRLYDAYTVCFDSSLIYWSDYGRSDGLSVRPVTE